MSGTLNAKHYLWSKHNCSKIANLLTANPFFEKMWCFASFEIIFSGDNPKGVTSQGWSRVTWYVWFRSGENIFKFPATTLLYCFAKHNLPMAICWVAPSSLISSLFVQHASVTLVMVHPPPDIWDSLKSNIKISYFFSHERLMYFPVFTKNCNIFNWTWPKEPIPPPTPPTPQPFGQEGPFARTNCSI